MISPGCEPALIGALSLCKKAGALRAGFDAVKDCLKSGDAKLVFFAQDVSAGTRRRVLDAVPEGLRAETLPCTQEDIAKVTRKPVGVLAVTDEHLAGLCLSKLPETM